MSRAFRYAVVVAGGYLVVCSLYIIYSIAASVVRDVHALARLETAKGIGFVVVSSAMLLGATYWALRRIERAGEELVRHQKMLVASERRVTAGVLAASIAHDVNNVLMVIQVEVDDLPDAGDGADAKARLSTSLERIVALNRRLVRANREAGGAPVRVDGAALVREAVEAIRVHNAVRHARVAVDTAPVEIATQPVLLQQIVVNLVLNAGEATGGTGHIQVHAKPDGGAFVIEVHDDGPGIPLERRASLFDAMETTKPEGNGLGLFSVKRCAALLGGEARVDGSPLGGAAFKVTLPLTPPGAA